MNYPAEASGWRALPTNVRRFVWLWLACMSIVIANFAILVFVYGLPAVAFQLAPTFLLDAFYCVLVWLVAWRRANWARLLLFAAFLLTLAFSLLPRLLEAPTPLGEAPFILTMTLNGIGYWFIFTGDARPWFRKPDPAAEFT